MTEVKAISSIDHPILFFDGVCGMCNAFVDFIMKRDPHGHFRFAALQGETAQKLVTAEDRDLLKSVVLLHEGKLFRKSSAVVRVLWEMGSIWSVLGTLLWLIPKPLRDFGYRFIAKIRYRIFGKKAACRLPTPEERSRFLD